MTGTSTEHATVGQLCSGAQGSSGYEQLVSAVDAVLGTASGFVDDCGRAASTSAANPVNLLAGAGLDFLLSVVRPLQDALEFVTGDADALRGAAQKFVAIGERVRGMSQSFVDVADGSLSGWRGEASQAGRQTLARFADGIEGVSAHTKAISTILDRSAGVMDSVEEVIKSIITDVVTYLIQTWIPALASAAATFGASIARAWAATVAKLAEKFPQVVRYVRKLASVLKSINQVLDTIDGVMQLVGRDTLDGNGFGRDGRSSGKAAR